MAAKAPELQLFAFDARLGQREGHEAEKILAFAPSTTALDSQISVVGLCQAVVSFTSTFSPEQPAEVVHTEKATTLYRQCERNIWMGMIVPCRLCSPAEVRDADLQKILTEAHALYCLLHGSIQDMLATAGNLSVVNAYLGPFLNSYQKWLVEKNSGVLPDALSILNEMDCMKIFPSDRQLFLSCLSCSNSLMTAAGGQVEHVQVSYQDHVLHTTLDVGQAALVQRYISSVGLAATSKPKRSSPIISTWSFIDKESFMKYEGDGNPVLHIRSANRTDDTGEVSEAVRAPLKLLLYKCDSLLVMLLLRGDEDDVQRENALRSRLLQIVLQSSKSLSSSCSRTLASANGWHVPGYRYLFVDGMNLVTRASPKEKVATLSKDSLAFACKLRSELDNQARFPDQIEQEVCAKGNNHDTWVLVRRSDDRQLFVVLEKSAETLAEATEAIENFSQQEYQGLFSTD